MTTTLLQSAVIRAIATMERHPVLSVSETEELVNAFKNAMPGDTGFKGLLVFKHVGPHEVQFSALPHTKAVQDYLEENLASAPSDELVMEVMDWHDGSMTSVDVERTLDMFSTDLFQRELSTSETYTLGRAFKIAALARVAPRAVLHAHMNRVTVSGSQATGEQEETVFYHVSDVIAFRSRPDYPVSLGYGLHWSGINLPDRTTPQFGDAETASPESLSVDMSVASRDVLISMIERRVEEMRKQIVRDIAGTDA